MKMIAVLSIALLLTLSGAARADVPVGTGLGFAAASGSIFLDMKGVALYQVFVGDANHNQVSGTDFLYFDSGKTAPRSFGGVTENNVNWTSESFGAFSVESMLSTGTANFDPDTGDFISWNASTVMDTFVNVDLAALYASGSILWFETQLPGQEPMYSTGPLTPYYDIVDAGGPYSIDVNQSIVLNGWTTPDYGSSLYWDLNSDGQMDVSGYTPTITFDYLTNDLGMGYGIHTIVCSGYSAQDTAYLTIVPEPATLCLLAVGGAAMLRRRGLRK